MARGSKASYTAKQKRQARDIEEGYESRGVGEKESARRAWATVNKMTGGGRKSGSGGVAIRFGAKGGADAGKAQVALNPRRCHTVVTIRGHTARELQTGGDHAQLETGRYRAQHRRTARRRGDGAGNAQ